MPALPHPWYQLQDTTAPVGCRTKNCAVCCLSMLTERASMGLFRLEPTAIRKQAGVSCYTGTGGVPYLAGVTAVKSLTGGAVVLTLTNGTPTELRDDIEAGRGAVVSLDYSGLLGRPCACDNDFGGGHAVYCNAARMRNGQLQYRYFDPLCDGRYNYPRGYQWVDASIIHRAALLRSGGNGINYVISRDTEAVTRVARLEAAVRSTASRDARKLGELQKGRGYFVLATVNGGVWADGRTIWARIRWGTGTAYVAGRSLA